MAQVILKRLHSDAIIPLRAHAEDAGADLYAVEEVTIQPHQRQLVKTGWIMEIPVGMYGRVAPRSGLALKKGIDTLAGVIDSNYRGEVGIVLINLSDEPVTIKKGDRAAQLILEKIDLATFTEVDEVTTTSRKGGYGTTGD